MFGHLFFDRLSGHLAFYIFPAKLKNTQIKCIKKYKNIPQCICTFIHLI